MDKTTEALSRYVSNLHFDCLTPSAIHAAKRHIADSLGCAMGACNGAPAAIARTLAANCTGTPSARLLGTGRRTTMEMAAFANGILVRYLDASDSFMSVGSGHPSDIFSAVLAAAEAVGASGKHLILATIAGYEVFGALADQIPLRDRGWDQGAFVAPAAALSVGMLIGLDFEKMANALAIAITEHNPTRQTRAGELSMWKGAATAAAAKAGVFAAQLAKQGMTGPTAAFEGRHGWCDQVAGPFQLGQLGGSTFAIERSNFKFFATEYHSQAPLAACLRLRQQIRIDEIETVNVRTYWRAFSEIGSEPAKWDPRTRETADHSLPYLLAVALRDGVITPAIFEPERFLDSTIRPLMARIRIEEDKDFTRAFPDALTSEIEIITRSGNRFVQKTDYPKGHVRNPMTDTDIENKFRDFCSVTMKSEKIDSAMRALWHLEDASDIRPLLDLFIIEERA